MKSLNSSSYLGFNLVCKLYDHFIILGFLLLSISNSPASFAQPSTIGSNAHGTGPYPAIQEQIDSLPAHVIYRPAAITSVEELGLVVWGNGGCSDDGASSRLHLLELASHGYLVIANGEIYSGPGAKTRPVQPALAEGELAPPRTTAAQMTAAIDWALTENDRQSSPFYKRINIKQVAASGFSCGGLQAIEIAGDERISTLVLMNTGIFNEPIDRIPSMSLGKEALASIHTPTLYILGGEEDIAYQNGMDDYQRLNHVPVAAANLPVGHGGTYQDPNGGEAAVVAVNWLQFILREDNESARYFIGPHCKLCVGTPWSYTSKGLPPTL
jgi:hypothetical protein